MSGRLKISVRVLVGAALSVALSAAVLALFPAVAEAQSTSSRGSSSVVVRPGDSLWSISSEQLGAGATLAQIDRKVEQIYALNRDRIGADPNLIFPGQVLLVAPVGERSGAGQQVADRSGELVVSEAASKKGVTVAASKPAPEKAAKKSVERQLTPSRNSGVSGTATLTDVEGGVKVELNMKGLPEAGVEYINHIHGGGTCADDRAGTTAPVTIPLKTVVAKANGTGSATTTFKDVTLDKLFAGDQARFILLHAKTKEGQGVPPGISCADLPQWSGSGGFETLPASSGFSLPDMPAAKQAVPKVGSVASPTNGSPVASLLRDVRSVATSAASTLGTTLTEVRAAAVEAPRTTLGWAIVVLTVVMGALMAWKLPMRRTTRWDAQRWGIPIGYRGGGRYTSNSGKRSPHESPPGVEPLARATQQRHPSSAAATSRRKRGR